MFNLEELKMIQTVLEGTVYSNTHLTLLQKVESIIENYEESIPNDPNDWDEGEEG